MFAAWGWDHQAGYAGDAGRHKQVRHGERAVFAAAAFFPPFARRVGSSGARELRAFSPLVARAAGFGADDRREPPPRARGQRPECLLRQRRGLVPEPGRDHRRRERALPRVGAAAYARRSRDARRRPKEVSRKDRARLSGASRRRRACLREKLEKHERGKGEGQDDDAFVSRAAVGSACGGGSRLSRNKKTARLRVKPRRHAREKAAASRGCRVSGNGGRSRRAPRHAGRGAETWRVRTWRAGPRARAVSIAPRAGARARGDARPRRLSSRAGRGPRSTRRKTTRRGIRTFCPGIGVGGRARARRPPWARQITFHVLARRAVRVRTGSRSGGRARLDDFLPVLPPAIGVVAGHRGGGVTACAFGVGSPRARSGRGLWRRSGCGAETREAEADRGTRSEKCLTLVVIRRSGETFRNEKSAHFER